MAKKRTLEQQVKALPKPNLSQKTKVAAADRAAVVAIRRARWVFEAEQLIAEMREPREIDRALMAKFKLSRRQAAKVRVTAYQAILAAGESTRQDRFRQVQRTVRRLYTAAFDRQDFAVCANLVKQSREMFDLVRPFAEGGATPQVDDGRTVEELEYYAEHGCYPEDSPKVKQTAEASNNPLDGLS